MSSLLLISALAVLSNAREIVFPPTSGYSTNQVILGGYNNPDISQSKFLGLATYANLPYVHCLAAEGEEVEKFDIAILGAPFDTVSSTLFQMCGTVPCIGVTRLQA
jgi:agmatinase